VPQVNADGWFIDGNADSGARFRCSVRRWRQVWMKHAGKNALSVMYPEI
jgi:hypothetical protein